MLPAGNYNCSWYWVFTRVVDAANYNNHCYCCPQRITTILSDSHGPFSDNNNYSRTATIPTSTITNRCGMQIAPLELSRTRHRLTWIHYGLPQQHCRPYWQEPFWYFREISRTAWGVYGTTSTPKGLSRTQLGLLDCLEVRTHHELP